MKDDFFYSAGYHRATSNNQCELPAGNSNGFGHAAEEPSENGIDLNEQLIKNRPATFFMRVNSDAMTGAGIHQGDVVIVDRSLEAKNGKVIIAVLDGEMLIRRLEINNHKKRLLPATKKLSAIEISDASAFSVWGVVTFVIHSL
jgi:DNA polymerase V